MAAGRFDIIIIGGGIAGSALAATMAARGAEVLLLERTLRYRDQGLGEWIAPWGVREVQRLGLAERLIAAGAHRVDRHISYDESVNPAEAEAAAIRLSAFLPDVSGPLSIAYPGHAQALLDAARENGAVVRRGVSLLRVDVGATPSIDYRIGIVTCRAQARLIVGAEGRGSIVRQAAGIGIARRATDHIFAGLRVEGAHGWDASVEISATEGAMGLMALPQGGGALRLYSIYAADARARFMGQGRERAFLDACRMKSAPLTAALAEAQTAGPLCAWRSCSALAGGVASGGAVLIGDAAGWSDPLIGTGLASAYRDVRMVADRLASSDRWDARLFADYAEERSERMRRLAWAADIQARLSARFDDAARRRRRAYYAALARDSSAGVHMAALMAGPERFPAEVFAPRGIRALAG